MNESRRKIDEAIRIIKTTVIPIGVKNIPVDADHYLDLLIFYRDNHPSTKGSGHE